MHIPRQLPILVLVSAFGAVGCGGGTSDGEGSSGGDPCDGVSCSDHGTCGSDTGTVICTCDSGYHADGTTCVDDCAGVTCSGFGTCTNAYDGSPVTCDCDTDHVGTDCSVCDPAKACGAECCSAGSACLFGGCVALGADCLDDGDCGAGAYCETAFTAEPTTCPPLAFGTCVTPPSTCTSTAFPDRCADVCDRGAATAGTLHADVTWRWGHGTAASSFPTRVDVWSAPVVARVHDADCDGIITDRDPPNVAFVSDDVATKSCGSTGNDCKSGVLRLLDGGTGLEVWTLANAEPTSVGFAGTSVAVGDVNHDGLPEVVALMGEGKVAVIDGDGKVLGISDLPVDGATATLFGYGGGVALGDMDGDGWPEIAYGRTVFTMKTGSVVRTFVGTGGYGGTNNTTATSFFADVDGDGGLELVAGRTVYESDGTVLWNTTSVPDGFAAIADLLPANTGPEVALVASGSIYILAGGTGVVLLGPVDLPGTGSGGPPVIADFNGDGVPEIGVATQAIYVVMKPDAANTTITALWSAPTHDLSSSTSGSVAHDFDGDGAAEVVVGDECFLWILDGGTGAVRYVTSRQSFSGTEEPTVADVDGDGRANVLFTHTGADPNTWTCAEHTTGTDGYPIWSPFSATGAYRGVTVLGDADGTWSNARTLWNQHAFSSTHVCGDADVGCAAGEGYGVIPKAPSTGWSTSWSNAFRLAAEPTGQRDGADLAVWMRASCDAPPRLEIQVRNQGSAPAPAGLSVDLYNVSGSDVLLGTVATTRVLRPGDTEVLGYDVAAGTGTAQDSYEARLSIGGGPASIACDATNDVTGPVQAVCP